MQLQPPDCDRDRPIHPMGLPKCVIEEKSRSWGRISVGIFVRRPGEVVWRRDCYRICCLLSGDIFGAKQSDDGTVEEYRLQPGNIAFRPPNRRLWSDLSGGRFIQILQSRQTYDNLALELVRGGTFRLEPQDAFRDPLISQLAASAVNEIEGGFADAILAEALNTALAVQITRRFVDPTAMLPEPSNGLSSDRMKRVHDYIQAHLDDPLTLTDLGRVACLSPYHFSRSFKQAFGVSPHRYVIKRRIERAKVLLRRTDRPLARVAQEAGFTDQSHLTAEFRRQVGVTPGRFRAALA
jgi:AraC family transcriptional regulator